MTNFEALLKTLKDTLGVDYSLSLALGVGFLRTEHSYNIPQVFENADFVSLKSYDLRGALDVKTAAHSVLYTAPNDVSNVVANLTKAGAPVEKIILGIPMYGYAFTLEDSTKNGLGAPATGLGTMKYYEICERVKSGSLEFNYDSTSRSTYAYNDIEWVGYEDVRSAKEKSNFIRARILGGAMIKALDFDDYSNKCGDGK